MIYQKYVVLSEISGADLQDYQYQARPSSSAVSLAEVYALNENVPVLAGALVQQEPIYGALGGRSSSRKQAKPLLPRSCAKRIVVSLLLQALS